MYCRKTGLVLITKSANEKETAQAELLHADVFVEFTHPLAHLHIVKKLDLPTKYKGGECNKEQLTAGFLTVLREAGLIQIIDNQPHFMVEVNNALCKAYPAHAMGKMLSIILQNIDGIRTRYANGIKSGDFPQFAWHAFIENPEEYITPLRKWLNNICDPYLPRVNIQSALISAQDTIEIDGFVYDVDELFEAAVNTTADNLVRLSRRNIQLAYRRIMRAVQTAQIFTETQRHMLLVAIKQNRELPQNVIDKTRSLAFTAKAPTVLAAVLAHNQILRETADALARALGDTNE